MTGISFCHCYSTPVGLYFGYNLILCWISCSVCNGSLMLEELFELWWERLNRKENWTLEVYFDRNSGAARIQWPYLTDCSLGRGDCCQSLVLVTFLTDTNPLSAPLHFNCSHSSLMVIFCPGTNVLANMTEGHCSSRYSLILGGLGYTRCRHWRS